MANTRTWVTMLLALALSSPVSTQSLQRVTIAETVRKHDRSTGPLYLVRVVEIIPQTRARMTGRADLILEGTIKSGRSYLVENGSWINTDYDIDPTHVFIDRKRRVPARNIGPNPLVVRASGGRMSIDGLEVIAQESQLGLLPSRVPVVLFLTYEAATDTYQILDGAGAFTLRSGAYAPMLKMSSDVPVERSQFVRELEAEALAPSVK